MQRYLTQMLFIFSPLAETDDEQRKSELPYTYHKLLLETQSEGRMLVEGMMEK